MPNDLLQITKAVKFVCLLFPEIGLKCSMDRISKFLQKVLHRLTCYVLLFGEVLNNEIWLKFVRNLQLFC